jgi:peptide/nickel transport system substrate-binding protein
VVHIFQYGGNYLVWHAVTDNDGATATDEAAMIKVIVVYYDPNDYVDPDTGDYINQNNTAPYAVLSSDKDIIQNNTAVTFNITGCAGVRWLTADEVWDFGPDYVDSAVLDFGDGTTPVSVNLTTNVATHTYTAPGHYAAVLNVTANNSGTFVSTKVMRTIHVLLPETTPPGPIKNPDAFIEATIGEPTTLDPASCYESAGGEIIINVYETLVWYQGGEAAILKPQLASAVPTLANGGITDGGLNYTFNIRQGVKFHDGTNVTADDVVYSIQRALRMRDPVSAYFMLELALNDYLANNFRGSTVSDYLDNSYNVSWIRDVLVPNGYSHVINDTDIKNVAEAVVVKHNDTAVTFRLTHPYPAFLQIMAYSVASIVKMSYVEAHGGITPGSGNTYMTTHMLGTGPYSLDVWEVGSKIHLMRWDSYWGTKGILKDVYVIKSNDVNTRMLMLQSGDADFIYLPIKYESSFVGKSDYRITKGLPGLVQTMLTFNFNIDAAKSNSQYGTNVTNDFFQDIHMRRAFSHVFNNSQYIANVAMGNAKEPNGPIPEGVAGYNDDVPKQEYNLTMAEDEFKLANNPNEPGKTYWDTGFKIALSFNSGNTARKTACQMFQAELAALNPLMLVEIVELDWPVYATEVFYNDHSFAAAYSIGWGPDYFDADDFVVPELHSTAGTYPKYTGYNNSALDAMLEEASAELDTALRNRMYNNISWACYNDTPYVWISQAASFQIVRAWVHGWFYNPMYDPNLYYAPLYKSTT